jgi:hypothetical protein
VLRLSRKVCVYAADWSEPFAMPSDDCGALLAHQCSAPVRPHAREDDPGSTVDIGEDGSLRPPPEHRELLSQREVLRT